MEFLAQVIFSSDFNEISSLMKLFDSEKIAQLFTNLCEDADIGEIINLIDDIDVLVDGQYMDELHDFRLKWRGSSNQRVIDVKKSLCKGEVVLFCENTPTGTYSQKDQKSCGC